MTRLTNLVLMDASFGSSHLSSSPLTVTRGYISLLLKSVSHPYFKKYFNFAFFFLKKIMYLCADLCINDTSTYGVKKVEFYGARVTGTWNVDVGTLTQILCKYINS